MADNKFDLNKLKDNMGGLMDSLKSMINPAGGTPTVDPDDALGLKIAQLTTLIKEITDAQQEQIKKLNKINELLNGIFQAVQTLRDSVKVEKTAQKPAEEKTKEQKE
ncbi:MAG: hypothetical protein A3C44_05220 [Gammaproteobacteria bacterium RIFCSPHIGHO2_02_FULL_39_13]|nr:MAG: hypothetical protein A3C44_05220 [Gammaproteobacteria bacterium RIFCSPHIGHO2_02_FULL_39_13]OGT48740.1 MAG: hypothetical protein A3E53_05670 [Gammaproteobacteria bacterium RIFCSPHIGHO2_12_FULL_39_24]